MYGNEDGISHSMQALRLIEEAWGELRMTPHVQQQLGINGPGAPPFAELEWHLEHELKRIRSAPACHT